MPKQVDHDVRRQELAEAACAVVARDGVDGASLRTVAAEAGWSVGSMRHYFATKADLLVFALGHVGDRIDARIAATPKPADALDGLRAAVAEMLPLDDARRREALVWLAFVARAGVEPGLTAAAERVWRSIHTPLVHRLQRAVDAGDLPADLAVEPAALALQATVDGLVVHLATTPGLVSSAEALAVVDAQLRALGPSTPDRRPDLQPDGLRSPPAR